MQPPKVKVAVATGQRSISVRSAAPVHVSRSSGAVLNFTAPEIHLAIEDAVPAQKSRWWWCAATKDKARAEQWLEKAASVTQARLWPVGLTPFREGWRPRRYRLLVAGEEKIASDVEVLIGVSLVHQPVPLDFPQERSALKVTLRDAAGRGTVVDEPCELSSDEKIELIDAPVGEGFHWQRREDLSFDSPLWVDVDCDGLLCAGIDIDVEEYLMSVNSSEMPADSPPEFLKAQVVAARSWLLANWGSHHPGEEFTVCNGDHCQCYYGSSRIKTSSRDAVNQTSGELLMYDGSVCDARYAKTCGGVTEPGVNVWPTLDEPYLIHRRDLPGAAKMDLSDENAFRQFQQKENRRDACCAPGYAELAGQLTELAQFYRWTGRIDGKKLAEIIRNKTAEDLKEISAILPRRRGPSGRIIELEVIGKDRSLSLSPELQIRRILSRTHLPSSAFWVEQATDGAFNFHGLGWGHGAGMCQMGAASLAASGWNHAQILKFYYPSTSIEKIY